MNRLFAVVCASLASLLLHLSAVVHAAPVTFAFEAVSVNDERPFREIVPGMIARGTYTFESTTPDTSLNPLVAFYTGAVTAFDVEVEGLVGSGHSYGTATLIVGDPITIVGSDPGTADFYSINGIGMSGIVADGLFGQWNLVRAFVRFEDRTNSALSSVDLPLTPPDPARFADEHTLSLAFMQGSGTNTSTFEFTSLTLVPEPPGALLAGFALVSLVVSARCRNRPDRTGGQSGSFRRER